MFVSENFMLGAGALIIQPSSGKVVIVQEGNRWFLPKGRKDIGESIEQAALREAYEEVRVSIRFRLHSILAYDPLVWLSMRIHATLSLDKCPGRVRPVLQKETYGAALHQYDFIS